MEKYKTSETLKISIILAFSGGFMDAYSYICRDEVFANAQTGNMLLFGISILEKEWLTAINHIIPVLLFTFGIFVTDMIRWKFSKLTKIHWRQIIVLIEMVIFLSVAFISSSLFANSITSLACGMQVEAFRKTRGNVIATTMCIGNLRSGTENFSKFLETKDKSFLSKSSIYFLLIFCFVVGAIFGNFFVDFWGDKAILFCSITMFIAFFMMIDRD